LLRIRYSQLSPTRGNVAGNADAATGGVIGSGVAGEADAAAGDVVAAVAVDGATGGAVDGAAATGADDFSNAGFAGSLVALFAGTFAGTDFSVFATGGVAGFSV